MPGTDAAPPSAEPREPAPAPARGSFGLPPTVGGLETVAALVLLLVPIVVMPSLDQPRWAPKTAVVLAVAAPGLVLLARLVRRGDRAAQVAAAFGAWCVVSALFSAHPLPALLGGYGVDRGALVLAAYLGLWALGRHVHPDARPVLAGAFLVAVGLNVVVAAVQAWAPGAASGLGEYGGGVPGLTDSSVYLGALLAGGSAVAAASLARWVWVPAGSDRRLLAGGLLALVAGCVAAADLSGSRSGLFLAAVLAPAAAWPGGRRVVAAVVVAVVLGLGVSTAAGSSGPEGSSVDQVAAGGAAPRVAMWRAGLEAAGERPLVGWGPGRFRAATSTRTTPAFVRAEGQDRLFFDAHLLPVELLTTLGVPGLALAGGFAWLAARRARGPLAWLAVGVAGTWLLEPVGIATGAAALLALGAAAPRAGPAVDRPPPPALLAAAVVGLLAGASVLYGSAQLGVAGRTRSLAAVDRADAVLPPDAVVDDLRARILDARLPDEPTPEQERAVRDAARVPTRRDPERPSWWVSLGYAELARGGTPEAAEKAFRRALARNPWSEQALVGLARLGILSDDPALVDEVRPLLCEIGSEYCR